MTAQEQLAAELAKHYYEPHTSHQEAHCRCGKWVESVQRRPLQSWPEHVAEALTTSTESLDRVRALAWERGYQDCYEGVQRFRNPYVALRGEGA